MHNPTRLYSYWLCTDIKLNCAWLFYCTAKQIWSVRFWVVEAVIISSVKLNAVELLRATSTHLCSSYFISPDLLTHNTPPHKHQRATLDKCWCALICGERGRVGPPRGHQSLIARLTAAPFPFTSWRCTCKVSTSNKVL